MKRGGGAKAGENEADVLCWVLSHLLSVLFLHVLGVLPIQSRDANFSSYLTSLKTAKLASYPTSSSFQVSRTIELDLLGQKPCSPSQLVNISCAPPEDITLSNGPTSVEVTCEGVSESVFRIYGFSSKLLPNNHNTKYRPTQAICIAEYTAKHGEAAAMAERPGRKRRTERMVM